MDWFSHLFRKKRILFPRWFNESLEAHMKATIGQNLSPKGEPEVIVKFEVRENYGKWRHVGTFRYLDLPEVKKLIVKVDTYMRALVTRE
jgi:hypothetical protein